MQDSPSARLASELLNEDLSIWVQRHRASERSWRWIADELRRTTNGAVSLSGYWISQLCGTTVRAGETALDRERRAS